MSWVRRLYQTTSDVLLGRGDAGAKYTRATTLAGTMGGAILANAKPDYMLVPILSGALYAGLRVNDLRNYVLHGLDEVFEELRREHELSEY